LRVTDPQAEPDPSYTMSPMIDSLPRVKHIGPLAAIILCLSAAVLNAQNTPPQQPANPTKETQAAPAPTQTGAQPAAAAQRPRSTDAEAAVPDRAAMLRGAYGPFRANNDLLYYHLNVRVNPDDKSLKGKNTIRFRMLENGTRIQLDLQEPLQVDKILMGSTELKYQRDTGAVFIDFPQTLHTGQIYSIDFYYSGHPRTTGRFGGITFKTDPAGHTWINTACEGIGASLWWPNKDQWRDEVEDMDLSVEIPNNLIDVSNGKLSPRPTSATATLDGTGTSTTPSITTTSRSTSATTSTSATNSAMSPWTSTFSPPTSTKRKSSSPRPKV
jgi:hypothetical protein